MRLRLTATAIKEWFQYRCERKVVYQCMNPTEREAVPIEERPMPSMWAAFGTRFEDEVVADLRRRFPGQVLVPPRREGGLGAERGRAFLEGRLKETYACQLQLNESPEVRRVLGLPEGVELGTTRPDIVMRMAGENGPVFRIIDVKGTRQVTLFHKAQVAFYVLVLRAMLEQAGLPGTVDGEGSIWCLAESGDEGLYREERFPIKSYAELVLDFFRREVPKMAALTVAPGRDETFFHVYFKCEQCRYLPHCEKRLVPHVPAAASDLSAVVGMSHQAKRSLHEMGIRTVGTLVDRAGAVQHAASWALKSRGRDYQARAEALLTQKLTRIPERHCWLMPPRTDVGIYLVADRDAVDGDLVAVGCAVHRRGSEAVEEAVAVVSRAGEEMEAIAQVLGLVVRTLRVVDEENRAGQAGLIAHIFVYEPAEATDLQEALGRHLEDEGVRLALFELIGIFPPEEVVPEPEYRGVHHLPACALRSVVEQLYALPAPVSMDLRVVSQVVDGESGSTGWGYVPAPEFERPFSSRLSLDVSRRLREGRQGEDAGATSIEQDVVARLRAMHGLRVWIEEDNAGAPIPFLRLNKRPFAFQSSFNPLGASALDVLLAQEVLENRAGLLETLVELARPATERRDRLNCYADLTSVKSWRHGRDQCLVFRVPQESREAEIGSGSFGLILTDNDPDLLLNPQLWGGFFVRLDAPNPRYPANLMVRMSASKYAKPPFVDLWAKSQHGEWYIDRTFFDMNTDRMTAFLRFLAEATP